MFRVPIPKNYNPRKHSAGTIHEFLVSQGFVVDGVSVGQDEILIESPNDPTQLMQSFDPPKSKKEKAREKLKALDVANANSIIQLREAVVAIKIILEEDAPAE